MTWELTLCAGRDVWAADEAARVTQEVDEEENNECGEGDDAQACEDCAQTGVICMRGFEGPSHPEIFVVFNHDWNALVEDS